MTIEQIKEKALVALIVTGFVAWIVWGMWPSESPGACFSRLTNGQAIPTPQLKQIYQSCKDTDNHRVMWRAFWNIVD
jgi:hypothetical protein